MSWRRFFRRASWDAERRRELDGYLDLETDDNIARGMAPDRARDAARRKLGNATRIREEIYDMNTLDLLESLWQDVRYAGRVLWRSRAFAAVAILSLMLGVAANTAIFQLIDAVRLRALPVAHPETLAEIRVEAHGQGRTGSFTGRYPRMSNPLWERLRTEPTGFSALFAWGVTSFDLATGGESRPAEGIWVSGEFFEALGVRPAVGRLIGPTDDRRGCAAAPVVISHRFWERQFGADPAVAGRTLTIDGLPMEIAGVAAKTFDGLEVGRSFDVAVPICAEPLMTGERSGLDRGEAWWLSVMGRLPAGVTAEQAAERLAPLSSRVFGATLPARYTAADAKRYLAFTLTAVPAGSGVSALRTSYEQPLWLLLGIAGAVLVIACGNLANLMLARASVREREIAVRLAIGASRLRIFRQLLVESLLLAFAGAALGLWLAGALSRALVALIATPDTTYFVDLHLGWRVIAFATGLAVLACALFGLLPAIRATRAAPGAAMKSGARGSTDGRSRVVLRRALVVGQVALSLVLVMAALLFSGTLRNLQTAESGLRSDGILIANFDLRGTGVALDGMVDYQQEFIRRVSALPAVRSVSGAAIVPLSGSGWNDTIVIDAQPRTPHANFNSVGPRYFETLQIPLVAGRLFDDRDTPNAPRAAIVDDAFAQAFFQTANPVGREFHVDVAAGQANPAYRIVGVVKNTKYRDLREDFRPTAYLPDTQEPNPVPYLSLLVRGRDDVPVAPALRDAARAMHPRMLVSFRVLDEQIRGALVRERLMATLSGFFGALAGLLAAIGLYGVLSYLVARRRFEIGLRMALGADRARVLRMILGESSVLVVAGLALGVALALLTTRWSASLLFGLQPTDARLLASAAAGLVLVAVVASLIPARRASLVSPTQALRSD